jgi:hypothetical protein
MPMVDHGSRRQSSAAVLTKVDKETVVRTRSKGRGPFIAAHHVKATQVWRGVRARRQGRTWCHARACEKPSGQFLDLIVMSH